MLTVSEPPFTGISVEYRVPIGGIDPATIDFSVQTTDVNFNTETHVLSANRIQDTTLPFANLYLPYENDVFAPESAIVLMGSSLDNVEISTMTFDVNDVTLGKVYNDFKDIHGHDASLPRQFTRNRDDSTPIEYEFGEGFTFPFYGLIYNRVFIHENGYLTFGNADHDDTVSLENFLGPDPRIAALFYPQFWYMASSDGNGVVVSYRQYADRLTITYNLYQGQYNTSEGTNHYEITLYDNGLIQVTYGGASTGLALAATQGIVGITPGDSATSVGLMNLENRSIMTGQPNGAMYQYFDGAVRLLNGTLGGQMLFFVPNQNWQYTVVKTDMDELNDARVDFPDGQDIPQMGYDEDFEGSFTLPWIFNQSSSYPMELNSVAYEGNYSLAAPSQLVDNQFAEASVTITTDFETPISFYYKVSSESCCDRFYYILNGTTILNQGGEVGWTQYTGMLPVGTNTITFRYSKDGSVSSGSDTCYVDDLVIEGGRFATEPVLAVTEFAPGIDQLVVDAYSIDTAANISLPHTMTFGTVEDLAPVVTVTGPDALEIGVPYSVQATVVEDNVLSSVTVTAYGQDYVESQTFDHEPFIADFMVPEKYKATHLNMVASAVDSAGNVGVAELGTITVYPDLVPTVGFLSPIQDFEVIEGDLLYINAFAYDMQASTGNFLPLSMVEIDIESGTETQHLTMRKPRHVGPGKEFSTIQAAINAADEHDVIIIDPGTYTEKITLNKIVHLRGNTEHPENNEVLLQLNNGQHLLDINPPNPPYPMTIFIENITIRQQNRYEFGVQFHSDRPNLTVVMNRCTFLAEYRTHPMYGPSGSNGMNVELHNCAINRNYYYHVYGHNSGTMEIHKCLLNSGISVSSSSVYPSPTDYVTSATEGYGPAYGSSKLYHSSAYIPITYQVPAGSAVDTISLSINAEDMANQTGNQVTIYGTIIEDALPVATITRPAPYTLVASGASLNVDAVASDDLGTMQGVQFYVYLDDVEQAGMESPLDTTAPYSGIVTIPQVSGDQVVTVKAKAIDSIGQVGISDPVTLDIIISSVLAGEYTALSDVRDVKAMGDTAFVAANSQGLQVIDVTDKANLTVTASATEQSIAVSLVQNMVFSLSATGLTIYRFENDQLTELGTTGAIFSNAIDMEIAGKYAYVTDNGAQKLVVVDISIPEYPYEVEGAALDIVAIQGITLYGDTAIVTRIGYGVSTIDISTPRAPVMAYTIDTPNNAKDAIVDNDIVYVTDYGTGLLAYRLDTETRELRGLGMAIRKTNPNRLDQSNSLDVVGRMAIVADGANGIVMVDVQSTNAMKDVGYTATGGTAYSVDVVGNYCYAAVGGAGFKVYELTSGASQGPQINSLTAQPASDVMEGEVVRLSCDAGDDTGVTVEFTVDGVVVGVDNTLPFQFDYTVPAGSAPGTITVNANAVDLGGNILTDPAKAIVINIVEDTEAPQLALLQPTDNDSLIEGNTVLIDLTGSDNVGLRGVTVNVNGVDTIFFKPPYRFDYQLPLGNPPASLEISAIGVDVNDNIAQIPLTTFPVSDDLVAPEIIITSPTDGTTVYGGITTLSIDTSVVDAGVISSVEILVDDQVVHMFTQAPYSDFSYQLDGDSGHYVVLKARATDLSGNVMTSDPVTLVNKFSIYEITSDSEDYYSYNNSNTTNASFRAYDIYVVGSDVGYTPADQASLSMANEPIWGYVANQTNGLQVLDLVNRNAYALGTDQAENIDLQGDFVFIARHREGLGAYYIGDPMNPVPVETLDFGDDNRIVWDVKVRGKHAFVAADSYQFQVLDVSDVDWTNPTMPDMTFNHIGGVYRTDQTYYGREGYCLELVGNVGFMGLRSDYYYQGVMSVDVSDPDSMTGQNTQMGYYQNSSYTYRYGWNMAALDENYLVVSGNCLMTLYNISGANGTQSVTEVRDHYWTVRNWDNAGLLGIGDYLFALSHSNYMDIFDMSDRSNFNLITSVPLSGAQRGVDVYGNYLFVANETNGVRVFKMNTFETEAPQVEFTAHENGDMLLQGEDNPIVVDIPNKDAATVEFIVDGEVYQKDFVPPYELWYPALQGGQVRVQARAIDMSGNVGYSDLITLNIQSDDTLPQILSVESESDIALNQYVELNVDASDNIAMEQINVTTNLAAMYQQGGLLGQYYDNNDFTNLALTRIDPQINFNWGYNGSPDPSMQANYFSIRWTGKIRIDTEDDYTFYLYYRDGVRLYINGQQLINVWSYTYYNRANQATVHLTPGFHDITVEFYEEAYYSDIRLDWWSNSFSQQTIPSSHLYAIQSGELQPDGSYLYSYQIPQDQTNKKVMDVLMQFVMTQTEDLVFNITPVDSSFNAGVPYVHTINYIENIGPTVTIQSPEEGQAIAADANLNIDLQLYDLGTTPSIDSVVVSMNGVEIYNSPYTGNPASPATLTITQNIPADLFGQPVTFEVQVADAEGLTSAAAVNVNAFYMDKGIVRSMNQYTYDMEIIGSMIYRANYYREFNAIDLDTWTILKELNFNDYLMGFDISDGFLYGYHYDGFAIVDLTDPDPANYVIASNTPLNNVNSIVYRNNVVYVGAYYSLYAYDVTDPYRPVLLSTLPMQNYGYSLVIDDSNSYLYYGTYGNVQIVDITNPAEMSVAGAIEGVDFSNYIQAQLIIGNRLYVGDQSVGLFMYDITDPVNPALLGSYPCNDIDDITEYGDNLYVSFDASVAVLEADTLTEILRLDFSSYDIYFAYPFGKYIYLGTTNSSTGLLEYNLDLGPQEPVLNSYSITLSNLTVEATADVTDDDNVTVELLRNGKPIQALRKAPYTFSYKLKEKEMGLDTRFSLRITDLADHVIETPEEQISVPVDSVAPVVSITDPADGVSVSENAYVMVDVSVTDDSSLTSIELLYDMGSGYVVSDIIAKPEFPYNVSLALSIPDQSGSTLAVKARATDVMGNTGESAVINLTLVEDQEAPSCSIVKPLDGQSVNVLDNLVIEIDANDDATALGSIATVALSVNGQPMAVLTDAPFVYNYLVPQEMANKSLLIEAIAYDRNGLTATDTVTVTTGVNMMEHIFVADRNRNTVNIIDLSTGAIVRSLDIPYPNGVYTKKDSSAVFVLSDDNRNVYSIDPVSFDVTVIDVAAAGFASYSNYGVTAVFSPVDQFAYVLFNDGHIVKIDTQTNTAVDEMLSTDYSAYDMAISPDGTTLYAALDYYLEIWDIATKTVDTINSPSNYDMHQMEYIPELNKMYLVTWNERIDIFNTDTRKFVGSMPHPQNNDYIDLAVKLDGANSILYAIDYDDYLYSYDVSTNREHAPRFYLNADWSLDSITIPESNQRYMFVTKNNSPGELYIYDTDSMELLRMIYLVYGGNEVGYIKTPVLEDTMSPAVTITQPAAATYFSQAEVTVSADVTDNQRVAYVHVLLDGALVEVIYDAPYETTLKLPAVTSLRTDLPILVRAIDEAGNIGSDTVLVNVQPDTTAPSVSIVSAPTEVYADDLMNIQVTASDNASIQDVKLFHNGTDLLATDTIEPYNIYSRAYYEPGTDLVLTAQATDTTGLIATSAPVTVNVIEREHMFEAMVQANYNDWLSIYDAKTGKLLKEYATQDAPASPYITKDGKHIYLIAIGPDTVVRYNPLNGEQETSYDFGNNSRTLTLNADESLLFAPYMYSSPYEVKVFDTNQHSGSLNYLLGITDAQALGYPYIAHMSDDGKYLLIVNNTSGVNPLTLLDPNSGMVVDSLEYNSTDYAAGVATVSGLPYGYLIYQNGDMQVVDLENMTVVEQLSGFYRCWSIDAGYTPEGPKVFMVTMDNSSNFFVHKINPETFEIEQTQSIRQVHSVTLSADGRKLYIATNTDYGNQYLNIYDSVTLEMLGEHNDRYPVYTYTQLAEGYIYDDEAPAVAITSPLEGESENEGALLDVLVNATDNFAISKVELFLNDEKVDESTEEPFTTSYVVPEYIEPGQTSSLKVRVVDAAGNVTISNTVNITIEQDQLNPTISIISPVAGSSLPLYSTLPMMFDLQDDGGIDSVVVTVNDRAYGPFTTPPFEEFIFLENGIVGEETVIQAQATDSVGHVSAVDAITLLVTEPVFSLYIALSMDDRGIYKINNDGSTELLSQPGATESGLFTDMAMTTDGQYAIVITSTNKIVVYALPSGEVVKEVTPTRSINGELYGILMDPNGQYCYVASRYDYRYGEGTLLVLDVDILTDGSTSADPIYAYDYDVPHFYAYANDYTRPNLALTDDGDWLWINGPYGYSSSYSYLRRYDIGNLNPGSYINYTYFGYTGYDVAQYNGYIYMQNLNDDIYKFGGANGTYYGYRDNNFYACGMSIGVVDDQAYMVQCARSMNQVAINYVYGNDSSETYDRVATIDVPYYPMDSDFSFDSKQIFVYYQTNNGFSIIDTSDWSHTYYPTDQRYRRFQSIVMPDSQVPTISIAKDPDKVTFMNGELLTVMPTIVEDVGIGRVDYFLNDELVSTVTRSPFSLEITVTETDNDGPEYQSIHARVYDVASNFADSNTVTFNITADETAPTVSIDSLNSLDNVVLGAPQLIYSQPYDETQVDYVEFVLDEEGIGTRTVLVDEAPYSTVLYLDENMLDAQVFTVSAFAYDKAGNVSDRSNYLVGSVQKDTITRMANIFSVTSNEKIFLSNDTGILKSATIPTSTNVIVAGKYVFVAGQDQLLVIDKVKSTLVKVFSDIYNPYGLLADDARQVVYVTDSNGGPADRILVISLDNLEVIHTIQPGDTTLYYPRGMVLSQDGNTLFVVNRDSANTTSPRIVGYDLNDNYAQIYGILIDDTNDMSAIVSMPGSELLYASSDLDVYEIDPDAGTAVKSVTGVFTTSGADYLRAALTSKGLRLFTIRQNNLLMVNPVSGSVITLLENTDLLRGMDVADDGKSVYVGAKMGTNNGQIRKVDVATGEVLSTVTIPGEIQALDFTNTAMFDVNPPLVSLENLPATIYEGNDLDITANVQSEVLIKQVDFYLDGVKIGTDFSEPFVLTYPVPVDATTLSIQAKAINISGQFGLSAIETVTVEDDTVAPVTAITLPAQDGQTFNIGALISIKADVTDATNKIKNVKFYLNGLMIDMLSQAPYIVTYKLPLTMQEGTAVITVVATDMSGLSDAGSTATRSIELERNEVLSGLYVMNTQGDVFMLESSSLGSTLVQEGTLPNANSVAVDAATYPNESTVYIAYFDSYDWREYLGVLNLGSAPTMIPSDEWIEPYRIHLVQNAPYRTAIFMPKFDDYFSTFNLDTLVYTDDFDRRVPGNAGVVMTSDATKMFTASRYGNNETDFPDEIAELFENIEWSNYGNYDWYRIYMENYRGTSVALHPNETEVYLALLHEPDGGPITYHLYKTGVSGADFETLGDSMTVDSEITSMMTTTISGNVRILAGMSHADKITVINPDTLTVEDTWNVATPDFMKLIDGILYVYSRSTGEVSKVDIETGTVLAEGSLQNLISLFKTTSFIFDDITAPTVEIVAPVDESTFVEAHWLKIDFDITEDRGVRTIEVIIDSQVHTTLPGAARSFEMRLPLVDAPTTMDIQVRAYDSSDNMGFSATHTITIENDVTPPVATITEPVVNQEVFGGSWLDVAGFATDDSGTTKMIERFEIFLENDLITTVGAGDDGSFMAKIDIPGDTYTSPLTVGVVAYDYTGLPSAMAQVDTIMIFDVSVASVYENTYESVQVFGTNALGDRIFTQNNQNFKAFNMFSLIDPLLGGEAVRGDANSTWTEFNLNNDLEFQFNPPYPYYMKYFTLENGYLYGVVTDDNSGGYTNLLYAPIDIVNDTVGPINTIQISNRYLNFYNGEGRILVNGEKVFVNTTQGILVYDVTLAALNTVVPVTTLLENDGFIAMDVNDDYLFALTNNGHLKAFDLDDNLAEAATLTVHADDRGTAYLGDVEVLADTIYVADNAYGVSVIALTPNTVDMDLIGTLTLPEESFGPAHSIDVSGGLAVVGTFASLALFDVSQPGNEVFKGYLAESIGDNILDAYIYKDTIIQHFENLYKHVKMYQITMPQVDPLSVAFDLTTDANSEIHFEGGKPAHITYLVMGTNPTVELMLDGRAVSKANDTGNYFADVLLPFTSSEQRVPAKLVAVDMTGNVAESQTITIVVDPDDIPPSNVNIWRTDSLETVYAGDTLNFEAFAEDNIAIVRMELFTDYSNVAEDSAMPYQFSYTIPPDTTQSEYRFEANAIDIAENTTLSLPITVTVIPLTGIEVEPQTGLIYDDAQFEVYGTYADGTQTNMSGDILWGTENSGELRFGGSDELSLGGTAPKIEVIVEFDNEDAAIFYNGKIYRNFAHTQDITFTVTFGTFTTTGTLYVDANNNGIADSEEAALGIDTLASNSDSGEIGDIMESLIDGTDPYNSSDDFIQSLQTEGFDYRELSTVKAGDGLSLFFEYNRWGDGYLRYHYYDADSSFEIEIASYINYTYEARNSHIDSALESTGDVLLVYTLPESENGYSCGTSSVVLSRVDITDESSTDSDIALDTEGYLNYNPRIVVDDTDTANIAWARVEYDNDDQWRMTGSSCMFTQIDNDGTTLIPAMEIARFDANEDLNFSSINYMPDAIRVMDVAQDNDGDLHFVFMRYIYSDMGANLAMYYKMIDGTTGTTLIDTTELFNDLQMYPPYPSNVPLQNMECEFKENGELVILHRKETHLGYHGMYLMIIDPSNALQDGSASTSDDLIEDYYVIPGQNITDGNSSGSGPALPSLSPGETSFGAGGDSNQATPGDATYGALKINGDDIHVVYGDFSRMYDYTNFNSIDGDRWQNDNGMYIEFPYNNMEYNWDYFDISYTIDEGNNTLYIQDLNAWKGYTYTFDLTYKNFGTLMQIEGTVTRTEEWEGDPYTYEAEQDVSQINEVLYRNSMSSWTEGATLRYFKQTGAYTIYSAKIFAPSSIYDYPRGGIMCIDFELDNSDIPWIAYEFPMYEQEDHLNVHIPFDAPMIPVSGYFSAGDDSTVIDDTVPVTPIQNAGFETGSLTGFSKIGDVQVVSAFAGLAAPEGSYMAQLTGAGALTKRSLQVPDGVENLCMNLSYIMSADDTDAETLPKVLVKIAESGNATSLVTAIDAAEQTSGIMLNPYIQLSEDQLKPQDQINIEVGFTNPTYTRFNFDLIIRGVVDGEETIVNGLLKISKGAATLKSYNAQFIYEMTLFNKSDKVISGPIKVYAVTSTSAVTMVDAQYGTDLEVIAYAQPVQIPVAEYEKNNSIIDVQVFSDESKGVILVDDIAWDKQPDDEQCGPIVEVMPVIDQFRAVQGYNIGETVNLVVNVYDQANIDHVQLFVDDTLIYTVQDASGSFGYSYEIESSKQGRVIRITAKAVDVNGNARYSVPAVLQINE